MAVAENYIGVVIPFVMSPIPGRFCIIQNQIRVFISLVI